MSLFSWYAWLFMSFAMAVSGALVHVPESDTEALYQPHSSLPEGILQLPWWIYYGCYSLYGLGSSMSNAKSCCIMELTTECSLFFFLTVMACFWCPWVLCAPNMLEPFFDEWIIWYIWICQRWSLFTI